MQLPGITVKSPSILFLIIFLPQKMYDLLLRVGDGSILIEGNFELKFGTIFVFSDGIIAEFL